MSFLYSFAYHCSFGAEALELFGFGGEICLSNHVSKPVKPIVNSMDGAEDIIYIPIEPLSGGFALSS